MAFVAFQMQWKIGHIENLIMCLLWWPRFENAFKILPSVEMRVLSSHWKSKQQLMAKQQQLSKHFTEHLPACGALTLYAYSSANNCTSVGWFGSIWFISGVANHDVSADSSLVQLLLIPTTLQKQRVKTGDNPTAKKDIQSLLNKWHILSSSTPLSPSLILHVLSYQISDICFFPTHKFSS